MPTFQTAPATDWTGAGREGVREKPSSVCLAVLRLGRIKAAARGCAWRRRFLGSYLRIGARCGPCSWRVLALSIWFLTALVCTFFERPSAVSPLISRIGDRGISFRYRRRRTRRCRCRCRPVACVRCSKDDRTFLTSRGIPTYATSVADSVGFASRRTRNPRAAGSSHRPSLPFV